MLKRLTLALARRYINARVLLCCAHQGLSYRVQCGVTAAERTVAEDAAVSSGEAFSHLFLFKIVNPWITNTPSWQ